MKMDFVKRNLLSIGLLIASILVIVLSFIAANEFVDGGTGISVIQSVGGKTLEEAYYYQLGHIYNGYAFMCRSIGLGLSTIMIWLGLNDLIKNERKYKEYNYGLLKSEGELDE